jgi:hypothetical protein
MPKKRKKTAVTKSFLMKSCACHTSEETIVHSKGNKQKPGKGGIIGWGLPGLGLLFIPKCPLCVAAYVSMFTGLGLNFTEAKYLRYGMIILCSVAVLLFVVHVVRAFRAQYPISNT